MSENCRLRPMGSDISLQWRHDEPSFKPMLIYRTKDHIVMTFYSQYKYCCQQKGFKMLCVIYRPLYVSLSMSQVSFPGGQWIQTIWRAFVLFFPPIDTSSPPLIGPFEGTDRNAVEPKSHHPVPERHSGRRWAVLVWKEKLQSIDMITQGHETFLNENIKHNDEIITFWDWNQMDDI